MTNDRAKYTNNITDVFVELSFLSRIIIVCYSSPHENVILPDLGLPLSLVLTTFYF